MAKCQECKEEYTLSLVGNGGVNGNHKYCSSSCLKAATYKAQRQRPKWRIGQMVAQARKRARDKDLPFDINNRYMEKLWTGHCEVTGTEFDLKPDGNRINRHAPSIDRIIPELGYVKGNVRLVTNHLNMAMSEYGLEALLELAKRIR